MPPILVSAYIIVSVCAVLMAFNQLLFHIAAVKRYTHIGTLPYLYEYIFPRDRIEEEEKKTGFTGPVYLSLRFRVINIVSLVRNTY